MAGNLCGCYIFFLCLLRGICKFVPLLFFILLIFIYDVKNFYITKLMKKGVLLYEKSSVE